MLSYFIVIPTGHKKKNQKWANGEETLHPSSTPFQPVSILIVIILSIGSEEVLSILVLLIHINAHNKMEINL